MNKALNILTAIFGVLLVGGGLLKCFGLFETYTITFSDTYLKINNSTSVVYITVINFIGGIAMIYHALSTLNYKRHIITSPEVLDSVDKIVEPEKLSRLNLIACFIILIVSFIAFIRTMILLSAFEQDTGSFIPLIIITVVMHGSFAGIPIWLAGKNLALNNEIAELLERKKKMETIALHKPANRRARR
jgi:hypothetical protein